MFPGFSINYGANFCLVQSILFSKRFLRNILFGVSSSNLQNNFFIYLSGGVFSSTMVSWFSFKKTVSGGVSHILSVVSQVEVIRPYAKLVVATVAYKKIRWNFSVVDFPRNPMHRRLGSVSICSASNANLSVSAFIRASSPLPAFIAFLNVLPKSIYYSFRPRSSLHEGTIP